MSKNGKRMPFSTRKIWQEPQSYGKCHFYFCIVGRISAKNKDLIKYHDAFSVTGPVPYRLGDVISYLSQNTKENNDQNHDDVENYEETKNDNKHDLPFMESKSEPRLLTRSYLNMSIKVQFLNSHLDSVRENLGSFSNEQGESIHKDIKEIEKRYQGS